MSLFGSYIQESSVEVIDESYYTEYDFLTESLNTTFNELETFHTFLTEKVDIKDAGKKVWGFIKAAIEKLIGMFKKLGSKIRELIGRLIKNNKVVDDAIVEIEQAAPLLLTDKYKDNGVSGNPREKALQMMKTTEVYTFAKNLELAIDNVKGPSSLNLKFGYGSNGSYAKKNEDSGTRLENSKSMHWFALIDDKEKAINIVTPGSLDKIAKELKGTNSKVKAYSGKIKEIEKYTTESLRDLEKMKAIADKTYNSGLDAVGGDRTDEAAVKKGENKIFAAQAMKDDIALFTAYAGGCTKITTYVGEIDTNNAKVALRYAAMAKHIKGEKKAEASA